MMETPDEMVELLFQAGMEEFLGLLDERGRRIFAQRYGLYDGTCWTLQRIGEAHGVSRERIRQLEQKCLRRLRYAVQSAAMRAHPSPLLLLSQALGARVGDLTAPQRAAPVLAQTFGHLSVPLACKLASALLKVRLSDEQEADLKRAVNAVIAEELACARQQRQTARHLERALSGVRFFGEGKIYQPAELDTVSCARQARSISFYSQKMQRQVRCDSRLETQVLMRFERSPAVRWYQEQPMAIPYEYQGKPRLYYPDVLVHLVDGRVFLVEIKPIFHMAASVNLAKWGAMKVWCAQHGYGLLITNGKVSLPEVMAWATRTPELAARLTALIQHHGTLNFPQYLAAFEGLPPLLSFAAVVMRHRIPFSVSPFRLGAPDESASGSSVVDAVCP